MIHERAREILAMYQRDPCLPVVRVAEWLMVDRRTVWAALARLERKGFIGKGGRGEYSITKAGRDALRS